MLTSLTQNIFVSDYVEATDRPRLGFVRGSKFSLMIDAGNSKEHAQEFLNELKKLDLPSPDFVILTHWHWDHVYGLHALKTISICTESTQSKLIEMSGWEWTPIAMAKRLESGEDIEFCDVHIRVEYPDLSKIIVKKADLTFMDRLTLDLGQKEIRVMRLPNSHAPDSCVVLIPEDKILFLGDIISEDFHHGAPHYDRTSLGALIRALEEIDFNTAIHGHTEIFSKVELMSYLDESYQNAQ